jgi:hypothetical protein
MGAVISRALERHRRRSLPRHNGVGAGAGCSSPERVLLLARQALERCSVPILERYFLA